MKSIVAIMVLFLMFGCVEKNYSPEELAAHSRGNTYHWLYDKNMGIEIPAGWKLIKGIKREYYQRITGGTDYVIVRMDSKDREHPIMAIKADDLKIALGRDSIKAQVAVKPNIDRIMRGIGINTYNLSHMNYDSDRDLFTWSADYKIHTKQYMYSGLSPLEQAEMQYIGIPRYKEVTGEVYLDNAHFFLDRYEIHISLIDSHSYFTNQKTDYNPKFKGDFQELVNSIVFK